MPAGAKLFLSLGSLFALIAVALGAFGAHALKARLTPELLAAIVKANVPGPINSIYVKPNTYLIPTAFPGTPDNAFPVITGRISIVGLVDGAVIVRSGTAPFRFFEVAPTGQLWLDRLTFRLGQGNIFGGAILNHGSLTVSSSYFIRNSAVNLSGESVEITLDPGSGTTQEYIEDCQVCCRPWHVSVTYHEDGSAEVFVDASDDT